MTCTPETDADSCDRGREDKRQEDLSEHTASLKIALTSFRVTGITGDAVRERDVAEA